MCVIFACGSAAMAIFGKISVIAILGFFTAGMGFAGGMYLVPLMNGDVIDYDESITGLRHEGMYAGVNSLITKPIRKGRRKMTPVLRHPRLPAALPTTISTCSRNTSRRRSALPLNFHATARVAARSPSASPTRRNWHA